MWVSWTTARPVVIGLLLVVLVFIGLAFFLLTTRFLD
jgi:hypothetical protein